MSKGLARIDRAPLTWAHAPQAIRPAPPRRALVRTVRRKPPARQKKLVKLLELDPAAQATLVISSNLAAMAYHEDSRRLDIQFWQGNYPRAPVYRYYHVPPRIWRGLNRAASKGKYFWKHIRRAPIRFRRLR